MGKIVAPSGGSRISRKWCWMYLYGIGSGNRGCASCAAPWQKKLGRKNTENLATQISFENCFHAKRGQRFPPLNFVLNLDCRSSPIKPVPKFLECCFAEFATENDPVLLIPRERSESRHWPPPISAPISVSNHLFNCKPNIFLRRKDGRKVNCDLSTTFFQEKKLVRPRSSSASLH